MTPTERIIITMLALVAAVTVICGMTQCVQQFNTEQAAIQLAHELR